MHVLFNLIFPEQSHIFMKAANQTKKKTQYKSYRTHSF